MIPPSRIGQWRSTSVLHGALLTRRSLRPTDARTRAGIQRAPTRTTQATEDLDGVEAVGVVEVTLLPPMHDDCATISEHHSAHALKVQTRVICIFSQFFQDWKLPQSARQIAILVRRETHEQPTPRRNASASQHISRTSRTSKQQQETNNNNHSNKHQHRQQQHHNNNHLQPRTNARLQEQHPPRPPQPEP